MFKFLVLIALFVCCSSPVSEKLSPPIFSILDKQKDGIVINTLYVSDKMCTPIKISNNLFPWQDSLNDKEWNITDSPYHTGLIFSYPITNTYTVLTINCQTSGNGWEAFLRTSQAKKGDTLIISDSGSYNILFNDNPNAIMPEGYNVNSTIMTFICDSNDIWTFLYIADSGSVY